MIVRLTRATPKQKWETRDANLDRAVAFDDFVVLAIHFGGSSRDWNNGNFDRDRDIDFTDFSWQLRQQAHRQVATVPKPSIMQRRAQGFGVAYVS